tara:strand:- start:43 stop:744 length:702 start_codon:yes stop_codon:yes gene_type:complete
MDKAKPHIHIIEDEPDIADLLEFNIINAGYKSTKSKNGETGLQKAREMHPDLILLDLLLPGINGLDVCTILKSDTQTKSIPIIMLTALGQEKDIVKGLDSGADDYITKPFSVEILLARIKAVLRRNLSDKTTQEDNVSIHGITITPKTRGVLVENKKLNLTFTEFQILYLLASHPGWVFTRYQIIDKIREDNYPVTDRSVDFQIVGLRKKLGNHGKVIETVHGVGYRFQDNES